MQVDETDIDRLRARIGELVRERQELRAAGAGHGPLERNRRQLAYSQSELTRAFIALYASAGTT